MKKLPLLLLFCFSFSRSFSQTENTLRPKLVVGVVIDQMRWDYLYRYYNRYAENGAFKRLLRQGYSCQNTMIPYLHTVTACGHASIYTGTAPAIHGITGNDWWNAAIADYQYCTADTLVHTVGSTNSAAGDMSPRNMMVTSICDELKLATNFKSKVIGIALKDRGGILPAGHSADAAYWYDSKSGNWISSTYYMPSLPEWVNRFNAAKLVDSFYTLGWKTMYPLNTYIESAADNVPYENKLFGNGFPYTLSQYSGKNYNMVLATPHGNTLTTQFAKSIIINEQMGFDNITDFLTISYSTPDYIGHSFGPNSIEEEDIFLRLDKELGELIDFLNTKVGQNQYLFFLTADHGAAQAPGFLNEHKIPAGHVQLLRLQDSLNAILYKKFGAPDLISAAVNYQLVLNHHLIESLQLNNNDIKQAVIKYALQQPGIKDAVDIAGIMQALLPNKIRDMIINSYYPGRSGDIQLVYQPQWIDDFEKGGTTHGVWNPYDAHIPLLWYGWNIAPGELNREIYITDIAPTLSSLLKIQQPSGCTGKAIAELIKQ